MNEATSPHVTGGSALAVVATDERDADAPPVDVDRWGQLAHDVLLDALTDPPVGLTVGPALATEMATSPGELNLLFVDLAEIIDLNQVHMGGDGPTDVLSFPIDDLHEPIDSGDIRLFGDIVISPEVALTQAAQHTGDVDDEFALLVVHGVLHVLGFDHAEPDDTALMHAAERRLLTRWHREVTVPEHVTLGES